MIPVGRKSKLMIQLYGSMYMEYARYINIIYIFIYLYVYIYMHIII